MDEQVDDETKTKWSCEQNKLKQSLICENTEEWQKEGAPFDNLNYVGGVDISFVKTSMTQACASLIVCSYPDMEVTYEDCEMIELTAPYISGFLAFREVGFFLKLLEKLKNEQPEIMPQVIMVDGNGILHPRGFGTASHLGVLSGIPCIGVAKKLMQVDGLEKNEQHAAKIAELKSGGDTFSLIGSSGKLLGKAVRSCNKSSNPVYVSVGHRIHIDTAVKLIHLCSHYRIPEPIRQADIRSREYLRQNVPETEESQDNQSRQSSLRLVSGNVLLYAGIGSLVVYVICLIMYNVLFNIYE